MARVIVIGAGAMGLAAAYHAAQAGHSVEVLEASSEPGGMAAHFDFDGLSIERFYHFVCKADEPTFRLLEEIGLGDAMRWRETSMGYFSGGKLHPWGDPLSLLRYPDVSLLTRLRYGLFAFVSTRRKRWDAIETEDARSWITRWTGREGYEKLWKPLFDLKFYEYADNISASWIWTRIKRTGTSRKSLFQEELGYIHGGSETLVARLVERIGALGGAIRLATPAIHIVSSNGAVSGVEASDGFHPADAIISTMPTPLVSEAVPDLPPEWKAKYDAITNIGCCCLIFKLRKSVTPYFWVNIVDPEIPVPGIIEFSNLRPMPNGESIVFVPYYMPVTNARFGWDDDRLLDEAFACIRRVNPGIGPEDVLGRRLARLRHAQPVCEPGFAAKLPPIQTPIRGLQIADTCFYYPEDRGVSEGARIAREMAGRIDTSIMGTAA